MWCSAPICQSCWDAKNPDRVAVRVMTQPVETCSFCGRFTNSGIYVRSKRADLRHPAPK